MVTTAGAGAGSSRELGTSGCIWMSHMVPGAQVLQPASAASQGAHQQNAGVGSGIRLHPGILMWAAHFLSSIVSAVPNTHPGMGSNPLPKTGE